MPPNTATSVTPHPSIWVSTADVAYAHAIIHGQRDGKCRIIYSGPVKETYIDSKR